MTSPFLRRRSWKARAEAGLPSTLWQSIDEFGSHP